MMRKKGLVHIYTGDGKGKTTAAMGMALRAAGYGRSVSIFQFFKDTRWPCGEFDALKKLGKYVTLKRFDIVHPMFIRPPWAGAGLCAAGKDGLAKKLKQAMGEVAAAVKSKKYDLVILDEILIGVAQGFVDERLIAGLIASRAPGVELVLTGRGATAALIKAADYVTYMKEVKHPFRKGVLGRRGIEY